MIAGLHNSRLAASGSAAGSAAVPSRLCLPCSSHPASGCSLGDEEAGIGTSVSGPGPPSARTSLLRCRTSSTAPSTPRATSVAALPTGNGQERGLPPLLLPPRLLPRPRYTRPPRQKPLQPHLPSTRTRGRPPSSEEHTRISTHLCSGRRYWRRAERRKRQTRSWTL